MNRSTLTQFDTALATTATIAVVGDSMVRNERIIGPLRTALRAQYGNAGDGWLSAAFGSPLATSTLTRSGTWTVSDQVATSVGIDAAHVTSTDAATPARITTTSTADAMELHYLKQPGGGDFRYQVDGGAWTTVNTANATSVFASVDLSALGTGEHTLTVEVTSAGVAGVTIMGVDARVTSDGVILHNVGNGSTAADDYLDLDATIWQDGIAALNPDLVMILLGPNDRGGGVVPDTFAARVKAIAARVTAAVPTADIVFISPTDQSSAATIPMWDYGYAEQHFAAAFGAGFVNTYDRIGSYATANDLGYYADTTHLSDSGGALVADELADYLIP